MNGVLSVLCIYFVGGVTRNSTYCLECVTSVSPCVLLVMKPVKARSQFLWPEWRNSIKIER